MLAIFSFCDYTCRFVSANAETKQGPEGPEGRPEKELELVKVLNRYSL